MKKQRIIIWSVITLLTVIAALEVFDLHPSLQAGRWRVCWSGVSHMAFHSSPISGNGVLFQGHGHIYQLGPILILNQYDDHVV